jgi:hypothetical protein
VLSHYRHIESIPDVPAKWKVKAISLGRAASLAESLSTRREEASLYKRLSTLRENVPLKEKVGDLKWQGAWPRLKRLCRKLGDENFPKRVSRWRSS